MATQKKKVKTTRVNVDYSPDVLPLSFLNFEMPPECPNLNILSKASLAELKKSKLDVFQATHSELDEIIQTSRKRMLECAKEYVLLKKYHDESFGAERPVGKRRDRPSSTTSSPDGSSKRARKNSETGSGRHSAALPASPKPKGGVPHTLPTLEEMTNADISDAVVKKKKKLDKSDLKKADMGSSSVRKEKRGMNGKKKGDRKNSISGRPGNRGGDDSLPELFPKLSDDHPFWQDVAVCFKKIEKEDISQLRRAMDESTPSRSLLEIPPKGRHYTQTWAEQNYALAIRNATEPKVIQQASAPVSYQPTEFEAGNGTDPSRQSIGVVTKNLITAMVGDDRALKNEVGLVLPRDRAPYASSTNINSVVGLQALEAGLKTTLSKLGIACDVEHERDSLVDELQKHQKHLREKTMECSIMLSQLYSRFRKQSDALARKERIEEEISAVEKEIEKAYFHRQNTLRKNQQNPGTAGMEQMLFLIQKRHELLQKEADLSASRTSITERPKVIDRPKSMERSKSTKKSLS